MGNSDDKRFEQYRRTNFAEMRPYEEGEDLTGVSIAAEDTALGSPKSGDMIARNPANPKDQWLVAAKYFSENFAPLDDARPVISRETSSRVSTIAGQVLAKARDDDYVPAQDVDFIWGAAKSLAGTAMSQDQTPGQSESRTTAKHLPEISDED